jgi:hypothetical protein
MGNVCEPPSTAVTVLDAANTPWLRLNLRERLRASRIGAAAVPALALALRRALRGKSPMTASALSDLIYGVPCAVYLKRLET